MLYSFFKIKKSTTLFIFLILLSIPIKSNAQTATNTEEFAPQNPFSNLPTSNLNLNNIDYSNPDNLSLPAKLPQIQEQITTTVYPEIPKPNPEVRITAEAYGTDLDSHPITWKVNGKKALEGVGEKVFRFKLGSSGVVYNVELTISPKNAPVITKNFSFTPIDVDVLWEANTYTPPFYKGKAMYSAESNVTFIALPNIIINGTKLNNSDIVYKWKIDRKVQGTLSGFGKNTMSYTGPIIFKTPLIQTEVYSSNNPNIKGLNGTTISYVNAKTLVYEDNPRYGILFNKALLGQVSMKSSEIKFAAFPFFFSTKNKNSSSTVYKWKMNSYKINIPADQNSAVFKRKDNTAGSSILTVDIENPNKIFQRGSAGFVVNYDQKKSDI